MTDSATVVTLAELRRTRLTYLRWQRILRLVAPVGVLAFTLVALNGVPAHGAARTSAVVALVAFAVGACGALYLRGRPPALHAGLLVLTTAASAALLVTEPGRVGALGFAVVLALMSWRPRKVPGPVLAGATAAIVLVGVVVGDRMSVANALFTAVLLGCLSAVTYLARRLNAVNRLAEELLADLDAGRARELALAALAERQSAARELHDVLAHSLSGLLLQLEAARVLAADGRDDPRLPATLERAHHLAKAGLDEARQAVGALRDDDALPGADRLRPLVDQFTETSGVPCRLDVSGRPRDLLAVVRLNVYRVAQEALTNIAKHSASSAARICLTYEPQVVRLVVENVGEPLSPGRGDGYGLSGMRERAELLGGSLDAGSTPTGFRVELTVPG